MNLITHKDGKRILMRVLLLIGGEFLCYFFTPGGKEILTVFSLVITFVIWLYLLEHLHILKELKVNAFWWIIAFSASAITLQENYSYFSENRGGQIRYIAALFGKYADKAEKLVIIGLMGCAVLAGGVLLLLFWQKFIDFIHDFWKSCDVIDKRFIFISGLVVAILIIVLYNITSIFSYTGVEYDVIYTTDTGSLSMGNVWMQVNHAENDIRQPLYALGSIPFAAVTALIGRILFLMPKAYIILLAIVQGWLLILTNAMLAKVLKVSGHVKIIYYLISSFIYSSLLFALNLEQYVFAVFYLIIFLYCVLCKEGKEDTCLYALSTGSLITTGIACLWKAEYSGWRDMIRTMFRRGFIFAGALAMFGRLHIFFNIERYGLLLGFSSYNRKTAVSMTEKLLQYLNFVKSIYIKPQIQIVDDMYYRLAEVKEISVLGCLLVVLVILGFILTFRERLSQISAFWIVFSFGIMVVGGWGASENGMILYSLYFGWAFTVLLIQLFRWMYERWKNVSIAVGYGVSIVLIFINCNGILELVRFGMSRYS